ncbi:von willebrand factor type a domain containing protein [Grosmannia clavigera kw1407]|uniref:von willebrand factor type a domain containing protein n=1 Tax=Grosmannia clavigera (strain kw1407 / UAMH 11150) TaxID=655863 RepID=F0XJB7_GROCL|nr:von willebrand factor type a domain containing protein [Grosmannia clavigera kw1407]EFX02291.1 von willebrand factor type a domain containing protein [Grosmannia clavigera kw1407]
MTYKLRPRDQPGRPQTPSSEDERSSSTGSDFGSWSALKTVLPIRLRDSSSSASLNVYRLPSDDGILIKVKPPAYPGNIPSISSQRGLAGQGHVPCSIVLVIDVSGSMQEDAPVPATKGEPMESNGLTVLDLVKHAARTILETLNEHDCLGIVTFSEDANVLLMLTPMTQVNKAKALQVILDLEPLTVTNLWKGLTAGIEIFSSKAQFSSVPSIMLLTDGLPNFMHPPQGYIPKLRTFGKLPAPIHTFGFGYNLRSGLLKSISELTGGNYAFISDAGMLGTVFIHAVANMQSTFAMNATLCVEFPASMHLEKAMGTVVGGTQPVDPVNGQQLTIPLGSIQYGQTRDVYLRCTHNAELESGLEPRTAPIVRVKLDYDQMEPSTYFHATTQCAMNFEDSSTAHGADALSADEVAFHIARSDLCATISSLFPLLDEEEHVAVNHEDGLISIAISAWEKVTSANVSIGSTAYKALMRDISGQALMAIRNKEDYSIWGRHYLPSLQSAHMSQQCNSFKDAGPLLYGASSTLFIQCRDNLDKAFDSLPAPKPSGISVSNAPIGMSMYRNPNGACFASFCRVTLTDGRHVRVNRLRRGMRVLTPRGPRTVAAVLKTPVVGAPMMFVGSLLVTPWHPISHNSKDWVFPCQADNPRKRPRVRYTGSIYSVLLQPDGDVDSHALRIEGIWVVTLGHGLTENANGTAADVRVHSVFGSYAGVCQALASLDVREDGLVVNNLSSRGTF